MKSFIATIKNDADIDAVAARLESIGADVKNKMRAIRCIHLQFDGDVDQISEVDGVSVAVPDMKMQAI